jgi:hypothetical protein
MFTYTCERPNIIQIALKGLPVENAEKKLSDLAIPLHVVDELFKNALMYVCR